MLEFKEKKKVRKLIYSKLVLFVLAIIFVLSVDGVWNMYQKHSETSQKAQEAEADLLSLREKESELEKRVEFLKTARGQDEEIRKKFMVGKAGEGVILIVSPEITTTTIATPPLTSRWTRFLDFFQ